MIFVLGGGFGVYGHAAALVESGRAVGTLARYRPEIERRAELQALGRRLTWFDEEAQGIAAAETIVLARRPCDNGAVAGALASSNWRGRLVIEKPIAESSGAARSLARQLDGAGVSWAVPYLFSHCDWARPIREALDKGRADAHVEWRFRTSPSARPWKTRPEEGGGALAFYFVHALAFAADVFERASFLTSHSRGPTGERLELSGRHGDAGLRFEFELAADAPSFKVTIGGATVFDDVSPFGSAPAYGLADPRCPVLRRFYDDIVFGARRQTAEMHRRVAELWSALEQARERSAN